jgi:hypothetical protein
MPAPDSPDLISIRQNMASALQPSTRDRRPELFAQSESFPQKNLSLPAQFCLVDGHLVLVEGCFLMKVAPCPKRQERNSLQAAKFLEPMCTR